MKDMKNKQGFTLIELMVVVIIVGILAAVAIPMMSASKNRAIATEMEATLGTIDNAAKMYTVKYNIAAPDVAALTGEGLIAAVDLGNGTYFSAADFTAVAEGIDFQASGGLNLNGTATTDGMTFTRTAGVYSNTGDYDGTLD